MIAYLGRYVSGQAFEGPVTVLIKEYIMGTRGVAVNELRLLQELAGEPVMVRICACVCVDLCFG